MNWSACVGKPPRLQPRAGYLWVPEREYRWRPIYPTYKYLKVINQVHRSLNKICSIFLFDNDTFQNEKPDSNLGFLDSLAFCTGLWCKSRGPPSLPVLCTVRGLRLSQPSHPSSVHTAHKQPPLDLSLRPGTALTKSRVLPLGGWVLEVAWVHVGR